MLPFHPCKIKIKRDILKTAQVLQLVTVSSLDLSVSWLILYMPKRCRVLHWTTFVCFPNLYSSCLLSFTPKTFLQILRSPVTRCYFCLVFLAGTRCLRRVAVCSRRSWNRAVSTQSEHAGARLVLEVAFFPSLIRSADSSLINEILANLCQLMQGNGIKRRKHLGHQSVSWTVAQRTSEFSAELHDY